MSIINKKKIIKNQNGSENSSYFNGSLTSYMLVLHFKSLLSTVYIQLSCENEVLGLDVLYTGESDFPFLFHLTLSFVQATACFAVFIGHCSHTCIRQQSLKPYRYRISPATLIWERNAEILRSIFLLHYELHLPAFISSHNLPDATALSPVQFECIQF